MALPRRSVGDHGDSPGRRRIETKVFDPDAEAALRAFIAKHDGKRNLYYSVNEPRPDITKKA